MYNGGKGGQDMEREIKIMVGENLESVVYTLLAAKARGEHVYCYFNGHKLHSDTVSMDSAYMEVVGCTKAEHEQQMKNWREEYEKKKKMASQKAKDNIPSWIERGQALIFPERYEDWKRLVQYSVIDSYRGYYGKDIDYALEIMEALDKGVSMEEAIEILNGQDNSEVPKSTIRSIIFSFSSKGPEFWEASADGEISLKNKQTLEAQKQENKLLAKVHAKTDEAGKHM